MSTDLINNLKIEYYNIEIFGMFIFLIQCCITFKPAACVQQLKIEIHKQTSFMRKVYREVSKEKFQQFKKKAISSKDTALRNLH